MTEKELTTLLQDISEVMSDGFYFIRLRKFVEDFNKMATEGSDY